jgi:peptidoglycan/xylan/chitin deacetylase (PgdA/CDA1 family)
MTAILNLHRVAPARYRGDPALDPALFRRLVEFLVKGCRIVGVSDREPSPDGGGRPRVAVSFDDGYRDFLDYAAPVLEEFRLPVNLNIIPGCIDSGRPPWTTDLYERLARADATLLSRFPAADLGLPEPIAGDSDQYALTTVKRLKSRSSGKRSETQHILDDWCSLTADPGIAMLSRGDLLALPASVELGNHSHSHESMGNESADFFLDDLVRSESFFETIGLKPSIYAFPNGSYSGWQLQELRQRGYRTLLLVEERPAPSDATVRPRITMYGQSLAELAARAAGVTP